MSPTNRMKRATSAIAVGALPLAGLGAAALSVAFGAGSAGAAPTVHDTKVTVTGPGPDCTGIPKIVNPGGPLKSLIANWPSSATPLSPGATVQFLYSDEQPIGTGTVAVANPTLILDGTTPLGSVVSATNGVTPTYVDHNGGSGGTQCQDLITFQLPATIAPGAHVLNATVYDGDGDHDTYNWNFTVASGIPTPVGNLGAAGLSVGIGVVGGGALLWRRRRNRGGAAAA